MQIEGTFIIFSTETEGNRYNLSRKYNILHFPSFIKLRYNETFLACINPEHYFCMYYFLLIDIFFY